MTRAGKPSLSFADSFDGKSAYPPDQESRFWHIWQILNDEETARR